MAKVAYKTAIRKQLMFVALLFAVVVLIGWAMLPVNTPLKLAVFSVVAVLSAGFALRSVRRSARIAKCPSCGVNLYAVIEAARLDGLEFRRCPSCGAAVEV